MLVCNLEVKYIWTQHSKIKNYLLDAYFIKQAWLWLHFQENLISQSATFMPSQQKDAQKSQKFHSMTGSGVEKTYWNFTGYFKTF